MMLPAAAATAAFPTMSHVAPTMMMPPMPAPPAMYQPAPYHGIMMPAAHPEHQAAPPVPSAAASNEGPTPTTRGPPKVPMMSHEEHERAVASLRVRMKEALSQMEAMAEDRGRQVDALRGELGESQQRAAFLARQLSAAKHAWSESKDAHARCREESASHAAQVEALAAESDHLRATIQELDAKRASIQHALEETRVRAHGHHETLTQAREEAQAQASSADSKAEDLAHQLEDVTHELAAANQERKRLRALLAAAYKDTESRADQRSSETSQPHAASELAGGPAAAPAHVEEVDSYGLPHVAGDFGPTSSPESSLVATARDIQEAVASSAKEMTANVTGLQEAVLHARATGGDKHQVDAVVKQAFEESRYPPGRLADLLQELAEMLNNVGTWHELTATAAEKVIEQVQKDSAKDEAIIETAIDQLRDAPPRLLEEVYASLIAASKVPAKDRRREMFRRLLQPVVSHLMATVKDDEQKARLARDLSVRSDEVLSGSVPPKALVLSVARKLQELLDMLHGEPLYEARDLLLVVASERTAVASDSILSKVTKALDDVREHVPHLHPETTATLDTASKDLNPGNFPEADPPATVHAALVRARDLIAAARTTHLPVDRETAIVSLFRQTASLLRLLMREPMPLEVLQREHLEAGVSARRTRDNVRAIRAAAARIAQRDRVARMAWSLVSRKAVGTTMQHTAKKLRGVAKGSSMAEFAELLRSLPPTDTASGATMSSTAEAYWSGSASASGTTHAVSRDIPEFGSDAFFDDPSELAML
jgi:hypothetical protein